MMQEVRPLKILKASAGSGKTFALTVHFLSLLLYRPDSYREILALTFTNKATAEMKSRILDVLEQLARGGHQQMEAYYQALGSAFPAWDVRQIRQRADEAYRKILHDYSRFSVQTIDRFSQQVIRSFTYELGLDSSFRIELNTARVRKDLMDRLYMQLNDRAELFEWIVQHMMRQIDADKSWNINKELHRLSAIIFNDHFRKLEEVAGREGNDDLFDRVAAYTRKVIEDFGQEVKDQTNVIADYVIRYDVSTRDLYYPNSNIIGKFEENREQWPDYADLCQKLEKLIDNPNAYQTEKKRSPAVEALYQQINPLITAFHQYLSRNLPQFQLARAVDENIHYLRLLKDMADLLAGWRVDNAAQLISDAQLLLARIGRTEQGDPTFIWEKIGNRYQYFLFDEFQDTSHTQWENLLPLLINALSTTAHTRQAHLIVGDVKQSIYRWRNGDFRILLQGVEEAVGQAFHLRDTSSLITKETLDFNYRSEENIIHFNNYLYREIPRILQEHINERAAGAAGLDYEVDWMQKGLGDAIVRAYEDAGQQVPAAKSGRRGGTIQLSYLGVEEGQTGTLSGTDFQEMACERAFDQITEWLGEQRYQAGDIGILVRTNKEAKLLMEYFSWRQARGGHSFQVRSGDALQLTGHAAIKSIISALRYMTFEGKEFNLYLSNLVYYYHQASGQVMSEETWLLCGQADLTALHHVLPAKLIDSWDELKKQPLATLVERLIDCFGFDTEETAVPYLLELRDLVANFVRNGSAGLQRFLEYWDEEGAGKPLSGPNQSHAVEILTIHKSKGLAYKVVMIPFCTWALGGQHDNQVWFDMQNTYAEAIETIPLRFGKATQESQLVAQYYQEELYNYMDALNTLYVATTRTREHLWILAPNPLTIRKKTTKGEAGALYADEQFTLKHVGGLLYKAVAGHPAVQSGLCTDDTEISPPVTPLSLYIEGHHLTDYSKNNDQNPPESTAIILEGYPSTALLTSVLPVQNRPDPETRRQRRISAMFSTALHELMASLSSAGEITEAVNHLVTDGRLSENEARQAVSLLQQAWDHPVLKGLLGGNYRQSNEQGMIDRSGATRRPDKILISDHETIIVDFKLAREVADPDHIAQVNIYTDYLRQMGLPDVRGYLYYFLQNELIAVKA